MILFFISFLLVFMSSYFVTSILAKKNSFNGLIYMLLIPFANLVFTFELLSLYSNINQFCVLALNLFFFGLAVFAWVRAKAPLWSYNIMPFFIKFFNALKRDKYLIFLFIGWLMFVGSAIFLISFMPVVNPDAAGYHVLRSVYWVINGNLNHFDVPDARNLVLPINSEILYAWVIMFLKKQAWFGFFSFAGYFLSAISIYGILSLIGFSTRKKLWTLFILSSFASVIVQSSGTETDIIVAGLVISSLYLYWSALKSGRMSEIFMSSLAYALAIGTKTPAILAIPAIACGMLGLSYYYKKKNFYKPFLLFLGFGLINFLLFASYNYILNFIDYGNFFSSKAFSQAHSNSYGLAAIPANLVKYLFLFFDFTGFRWGEYFGDKLIAIRDSIISLMGLSFVKDGIYNVNSVNQSLLEPLMGLGVLGLIVYLPCWVWSLIKPIFNQSKKILILGAFGLMFLINLIVMSYALMFMAFSVRFLMFFALISAPVIAYSYCKKSNLYKFIVTFFAMFYLLFVSTNLWARPFHKIVNYYKMGGTVSQIRTIATCTGFIKGAEKYPELLYTYPVYAPECRLRDYIVNSGKDKKFLIFTNATDEVLILKLLNLSGYHVDFGLMEDIDNIDLKSYDIIGTVDNKQWATLVKRFEERVNDYSVTPYGMTIYKNQENPCFYINNAGYAIPKGSDDYPYASKCILKNNFFEKNSLKLIHKIETEKSLNVFDKNKPKEDRMINYYFYQNI